VQREPERFHAVGHRLEVGEQESFRRRVPGEQRAPAEDQLVARGAGPAELVERCMELRHVVCITVDPGRRHGARVVATVARDGLERHDRQAERERLHRGETARVLHQHV
jgi:hypothetical protein